MKSSEKNRAVLAEAITRCWREPDFRSQLKSAPKKTLSESGAEIPADMDIVILENTNNVLYGVLPTIAEQDQHKEKLQKAVSRLESLPENIELRIVRDTPHKSYLIIPAVPIAAGMLTDDALEQVAGGGAEATTTNTTQTVEAETTEVTVTETTELQDTETTTTVAAEVEVAVVPCFIS